jgi:hypothetical protein
MIAEPGVGKSPVFKEVRRPIEKIQSNLVRDNYAKLAEFKIEEARAKKPGNTGPMPTRPKETLIYMDEATPAYAKAVLTDNPRGMILFTEELDSILGANDPMTRAWVNDLLTLYGGGQRSKGTKEEGTRVAENWSAAFLTTVQPDCLTDADKRFLRKGFLQRFMMVAMRRVAEPETNFVYSTDLYKALIEALWQLQGEKTFPLSSEANEIATEMQRFCYNLTQNPSINPNFRQHVGKYSGLIYRLALVIHVIEYICSGEPLSSWSEVSGQTMQRADRLLREYVMRGAQTFYSDVVPNDSSEGLAREVLAYCKGVAVHGLPDVSLKSLYEIPAWKRSSPTTKTDVLGLLTSLNWIRTTLRPGKTRPVTTIMFNPAMIEIAREEQTERLLSRRENSAAVFGS